MFRELKLKLKILNPEGLILTDEQINEISALKRKHQIELDTDPDFQKKQLL